MSISLLHHAFGLRGYRYLRSDYLNGQVFFTVAMQPKKLRCPPCNCRKVISEGAAVYRFCSLPIGKITVWIVLPRRQLKRPHKCYIKGWRGLRSSSCCFNVQ